MYRRITKWYRLIRVLLSEHNNSEPIFWARNWLSSCHSPMWKFTLLGSFMMRYLPSSSLVSRSIITRRIPHALSMFKFICWANSAGLNCWMPRMVWLRESFGLLRDTKLQWEPGISTADHSSEAPVYQLCTLLSIGLWSPSSDPSLWRIKVSGCEMAASILSNIYPNLIWSDPASRAPAVHLASLKLLFFSSVATTAPRCRSSFSLHTTPPLACNENGGGNYELMNP